MKTWITQRLPEGKCPCRIQHKWFQKWSLLVTGFFFFINEKCKPSDLFYLCSTEKNTYVREHIHMCLYICTYTNPHALLWLNFSSKPTFHLKTIIFCEIEFSLGKLILKVFSYLFQAEQQQTDPLLETAWKAFYTSPSKRLCYEAVVCPIPLSGKTNKFTSAQKSPKEPLLPFPAQCRAHYVMKVNRKRTHQYFL